MSMLLGRLPGAHPAGQAREHWRVRLCVDGTPWGCLACPDLLPTARIACATPL